MQLAKDFDIYMSSCFIHNSFEHVSVMKETLISFDKQNRIVLKALPHNVFYLLFFIFIGLILLKASSKP
jgi:hypothetical protein